jgi:hypothetical protein
LREDYPIRCQLSDAIIDGGQPFGTPARVRIGNISLAALDTIRETETTPNRVYWCFVVFFEVALQLFLDSGQATDVRIFRLCNTARLFKPSAQIPIEGDVFSLH